RITKRAVEERRNKATNMSDRSSLVDVQPIGLITSSNEPPKLMSLNDYIDEFNWHSSADNDYNNVSLELM
ncbi:hypothetical protein ACLBPW_31230, partial [Klebsiella pneumoniae]|uniref:hypothetical protein n=1 Tax=Klebsiella pneumoniae TaxID=573 RepID=UPI003968AA44